MLRTSAGVAGAGAGVLCSAAVPARVSDDGSSGRHGAGGHGARGSFWACSAGKANKIGWGVWEEGLGWCPLFVALAVGRRGS